MGCNHHTNCSINTSNVIPLVPRVIPGNPLLRKSLNFAFQSDLLVLSGIDSNQLALREAAQIVQSHLIKGQCSMFGPTTARLVEYGIACLRDEHQGQIVEPLAFLSLMWWLQSKKFLKLEANMRSRLSCEDSRGMGYENVIVCTCSEPCATRSPLGRFSTFMAPLPFGRTRWPRSLHTSMGHM